MSRQQLKQPANLNVIVHIANFFIWSAPHQLGALPPQFKRIHAVDKKHNPCKNRQQYAPRDSSFLCTKCGRDQLPLPHIQARTATADDAPAQLTTNVQFHDLTRSTDATTGSSYLGTCIYTIALDIRNFLIAKSSLQPIPRYKRVLLFTSVTV